MNIIKAVKLAYEYKRYGEDGQVEETLRAVDGVDLDVKKGDFVAILGHNGSGKSTLAKQINALLVPTEGTLYVDGMDTKDPEKVWDIRQSAGMVFQNPDNQIIGSVVDEDVGFGPENMGIPTKEIWERVEESLRSVGMWEYRHSSPNKLSGFHACYAGAWPVSQPPCLPWNVSEAVRSGCPPDKWRYTLASFPMPAYHPENFLPSRSPVWAHAVPMSGRFARFFQGLHSQDFQSVF